MADQEDVKDDETPESSTEVVEDDNQATESSTDASAADQGSQSAESDTSAEAPVATKEALIAQLTGKTKKETPKTEDIEPEAEETTVDEEPAATPEKAEAADDAIPDEEIEAPLGKEGTRGARERIQSLVKQRNAYKTERDSLKNDAEFGRSVGAVAADAKMAPEQLAAWIALAAEVNTDQRAAPARLMAEAKRIAASQGVTLPREVDVVVPKEIDDIEEMLIADALEGNIPGDVVKRYREKLRSAKAGKQTAPVQPPAPPAPVVAVQQPAQTPNVDPRQDPAVQSGMQALAKAQAEFKQKYPANWNAIATAVQQRIGKYAGTAPTQWAPLYRQEVESYIRENATKVKKTPSINQPLRPTTQTTAATSGKPKDGKAEAIAILRGK